jgi:hypothetical protein
MDLKSRLKDPSLLRMQGYIDGAWADADSGKTVDVDDPATTPLGRPGARRPARSAVRSCVSGSN